MKVPICPIVTYNRWAGFSPPFALVWVVGFEPTTSCFQGRHAIQAALHPGKKGAVRVRLTRFPRNISASRDTAQLEEGAQLTPPHPPPAHGPWRNRIGGCASALSGPTQKYGDVTEAGRVAARGHGTRVLPCSASVDPCGLPILRIMLCGSSRQSGAGDQIYVRTHPHNIQ